MEKYKFQLTGEKFNRETTGQQRENASVDKCEVDEGNTDKQQDRAGKNQRGEGKGTEEQAGILILIN